MTEENKSTIQALIDEYNAAPEAVKALITSENKNKITALQQEILELTPADYSAVEAAIMIN